MRRCRGSWYARERRRAVASFPWLSGEEGTWAGGGAGRGGGKAGAAAGAAGRVGAREERGRSVRGDGSVPVRGEVGPAAPQTSRWERVADWNALSALRPRARSPSRSAQMEVAPLYPSSSQPRGGEGAGHTCQTRGPGRCPPPSGRVSRSPAAVVPRQPGASSFGRWRGGGETRPLSLPKRQVGAV